MDYTRTTSFLKEMGLTDAEARVYLCLLQEGSLKAGRIAKLLGIHRRSIYDAIDRLRKKGLVSYIKTNNVNHYEAADPERLNQILKDREKDLASMLPEMRAYRRLTPEKKETLFFRGKASLKTVFNDQLENAKNEIVILGADVDVNDILKYYFPKFDMQRKKKKIAIRMIIDENAKNEVLKIPLCKIKRLPHKSQTKVSTYIYANRVCIVKWDEEPIAILIKEADMADRFKDYFELLWSRGEK